MIEAIAAIAGITILELTAIRKGINGKCLALSIAAISGLGGYFVGKVI